MRLVNVEYEHPTARSSAWGARVHFLEMFTEYVPEALDDLADEPLKRYRETGIPDLDLTKRASFYPKTTYRNVAPFWHHLESGIFTCDYYVNDTKDYPITSHHKFIHQLCADRCRSELDKAISEGLASEIEFMFTTVYQYYSPCPTMIAFWESILSWSRRYNLTEKEGAKKWCLECAFYTLDHWAENLADYKEIGLSSFGASEISPYIEPLEAPEGLSTWHPDWQERSAYLNSIEEDVREDLKNSWIFRSDRRTSQIVRLVRDEAEEYCNQVEQYYRRNGWEKIKDKKEILKHLEWTVRFQVKGETLSEVADSAGVAVPNVKKEVEKILELIGLDKRPKARPGRRRGKKDSPSAQILRELGRS